MYHSETPPPPTPTPKKEEGTISLRKIILNFERSFFTADMFSELIPTIECNSIWFDSIRYCSLCLTVRKQKAAEVSECWRRHDEIKTRESGNLFVCLPMKYAADWWRWLAFLLEHKIGHLLLKRTVSSPLWKGRQSAKNGTGRLMAASRLHSFIRLELIIKDGWEINIGILPSWSPFHWPVDNLTR